MGKNDDLRKLEETIIELVGDITAQNMQDIMEKNICEQTDRITHVITVKNGTEPIKQKTRGIPQSFREEFKKILQEMKEVGMIIDSKSPLCSPVRLVKKPDCSIRLRRFS